MAENKWTSTCGPRMAKKLSKALSALSWRGKSYIELSGVIGSPESEHRATLTPMCGGASEDCVAAQARIGERFKWSANANNYAAIIEELNAETDALELPVKDVRITAADVAENAVRSVANDVDRERAQAEAVACWAALEAKRPAGAVVLIVAESEVDDCDSMTDYYNTKTVRRVAIGWRTGKREDFKQLRAAAAGFPETAHLGPGCDLWTIRANRDGRYDCSAALHGKTHTTEAAALTAISAAEPLVAGSEYVARRESIEHRERYSGGAGFYLKGAGRYSTGWAVRSWSFAPDATPHYVVEDGLPDNAGPASPAAGVGAVAVAAAGGGDPAAAGDGLPPGVEKVWNDKKRRDAFLVRLTDRVEKAEFRRLCSAAFKAGGGYSRFSAAFSFRTPAMAKTFQAAL